MICLTTPRMMVVIRVVMSVDHYANYDDNDDKCQVIAWMRTRTTQKWNYTPAVEPSGRLFSTPWTKKLKVKVVDYNMIVYKYAYK